MTEPLTLRRFYFDRQTDVSGTSGTGAVVEGVEFSDGQVVLRWRTTPHSSIAIYKSMEAAVYIHGHDGSTNLHYLDPEAPAPDPAPPDEHCPCPEHEWAGLMGDGCPCAAEDHVAHGYIAKEPQP